MNAIILAAGMGTRLRPLTESIPKAMVPVLGEPIVERQIRLLTEAGIGSIIVVTGYLGDKLSYLKKAYGVSLVYNDKYETYNNLYSLYLVRDQLRDTYIIEGDVYLTRNVFVEPVWRSCYFVGAKTDFRQEWIVRFDTEERVVDIEIGDGSGYIMSGISFWTEEESRKLRQLLADAVERGPFAHLLWDNVVKANLGKFDVWVRRLFSDDWFEIDSLDDLQRAERCLLERGGTKELVK